ncbi:MAG TPA: hypothetical protein PLJ32_09015, partial [Kiritimatiellia bacterium]|nr:hypothetical protein [Kiritimatiellia bacterium]
GTKSSKRASGAPQNPMFTGLCWNSTRSTAPFGLNVRPFFLTSGIAKSGPKDYSDAVSNVFGAR